MTKIEKIKKIYLVRHGQSVDNTLPVFQGPDTPLSDKGRRQAEQIAKRVSHLNFEALIVSPLVRTQETASYITQKTGKPAEHSELFVERIKPSTIVGKMFDDPEANLIWRKWDESLYTPDIKIEDGENHQEIMARVDKALEVLMQRPEEKIVIVTHAYFLRSIVARVVLGDTMSMQNFKYFITHTRMKNTGLTVLELVKKENEVYWRLQTHNDYSHLG